uniref:Uncharacterized protein n=1 Tax=Timema bartmani TaxID=61472 RepID=A0A7R9I4A8_9NEOP|nr:unnamed protein product [Timema bartmani]
MAILQKKCKRLEYANNNSLSYLPFQGAIKRSNNEDNDPPVQGPLPYEPDDAPWKKSESGIRKLDLSPCPFTLDVILYNPDIAAQNSASLLGEYNGDSLSFVEKQATKLKGLVGGEGCLWNENWTLYERA